MASLKRNIILNGINTVTSVLFPIITFPYAARILQPEGIGAINFLNGIISYIVLLTGLGIPLYAVKEIAKSRDQKEIRDQITTEIFLLSFGLSLIGYLAVIGLAKFIPEIHCQAKLFYVLSLSIVFNTIGVNWFYQAIEDFKFITIRALIIRTLSAISLFIFVKSSSDLLAYAFILVGTTVGNNILNFIHLRTHLAVSAVGISIKGILRHLRPALILFAFNLIVSLYVYLNTVMLGFLSGEEQVGYFTAGTRISHIALTFVASIGTVLLPRCSNLIAKGDKTGFKTTISKSLDLILALALPMTCGLMILCKPIILLFCGLDYEPAIAILFLNAPVVILVGLTNLLGIQILYPKDRINIVLWSISAGATVNLVLNFILLPKYAALGAAVSTLIAEAVVLIVQLVFGKKYFPFTFSHIFNHVYIIATIIMGCSVSLTLLIQTNSLSHLILGVLTGLITYTLCLYFLKDKLLKQLIGQTSYKLFHFSRAKRI